MAFGLAGSSLLAVAFGSLGIGVLRLGWRKAGYPTRLLIPLGWLIVALALWCWSAAVGVEFGLSLGLAWLSITAWLVIAPGASHRERSVEPVARRETPTTTTTHRWMVFFAAGPLAGLASCQASLLVVTVLPLNPISGMALAALLFPALWGLACFYTCYEGRPGRHVLLYLVIILLATALLHR